MAGIDENIAREFFELNGFLVRQLSKYQVQSRPKRAEEQTDLVVENPKAAEGFVPEFLEAEDLRHVHRAVVSVLGWHTTKFTAKTFEKSREIFGFTQQAAFGRVCSLFGGGGDVPLKILVVPALAKSRAEREKSISILKARGVDCVITYPTMLRNIIDLVEVNKNYSKSDILQTVRILKNYGCVRAPQLDLFER